MIEQMEGQPDDLGPLEQVIREIRARRQAGGPEVDYAALYAYLDGDLPEPQRQEAERRIARWSAWHDAYWRLRAEAALLEASREPDELSQATSSRAEIESERAPQNQPISASPSSVMQELLRRARKEPQEPILSDEQRDCVRVLQESPGLATRELVDRVGALRTDRRKPPLSAARLSGFLQAADWLFEKVELEAPAQAGLRGGPSRVGGYRLTLNPEQILARTGGPLLARLVSDPQARQALIDYAADLGLPESLMQALREGVIPAQFE